MSEQSSSRESVSAGLLATLRARWLVIALVTVVCVAAAVAYLASSPKQYTSSADIIVTPVSAADDAFVGIQVLRDSVVAPSSNVLTVARLVKTPGTAELVARQPDFRDSSTTGLLSSVSVSPLSQTSIVIISATARSPKRAADLANAFANATMARRTAEFQASLVPAVTRLTAHVNSLRTTTTSSAERAALEGRLAELQPLVGASDPTLALLNPATPPESTSGPSPLLVVPAAVVGGVLLGILVALGCEFVDRRVRREDDLRFGDDTPVLVRVPASAQHSRAVAATTFRDLRARLLDGDPEVAPRSILIASAGKKDGRTSVALQLASSLTGAGTKVVLLDCDFEHPSIATRFGVDAPPNGFEELFNGQHSKAIVRPNGSRGKLLLALPTIRKASQRARFDTKAAQHALTRLEKDADVVVVDSSSAATGSDVLLLAKAVDATLVTVRLGHTKQADVDRLEQLLHEHGLHATGLVVLTGSDRRLRRLFKRITGGSRGADTKAELRQDRPAESAPQAPSERTRAGAAAPQPAKATAARQQ